MAKGNPSTERSTHVFPWEEHLRGKSRTGKFVLPEPHFRQPPDVRDTGQRLTPDYNMPLKEGNLKFEHDLGLGKI